MFLNGALPKRIWGFGEISIKIKSQHVFVFYLKQDGSLSFTDCITLSKDGNVEKCYIYEEGKAVSHLAGECPPAIDKPVLEVIAEAATCPDRKDTTTVIVFAGDDCYRLNAKTAKRPAWAK